LAVKGFDGCKTTRRDDDAGTFDEDLTKKLGDSKINGLILSIVIFLTRRIGISRIIFRVTNAMPEGKNQIPPCLWLLATILALFTAHLSISSGWASEADRLDLKAGEKVYQSYCSVCHGDQGNGKTWVSGTLNPPPRNFTDPAVIESLNRERMKQSILNGRPGTGMQPWKSRLSEQEVESVIDYIRTSFMKIDAAEEKKKQ
jgi:mono/diheme cytochrome c family protein